MLAVVNGRLRASELTVRTALNVAVLEARCQLDFAADLGQDFLIAQAEQNGDGEALQQRRRERDRERQRENSVN